MKVVVWSVLALALVSGGLARADDAASLTLVQQARVSLHTYDVEGTETTGLIARLGRALPTLRGADRREAAFLRTMAAADLVLVAGLRSDDGLLSRVAAAYDAAPSDVVGRVTRDLKRLAVGVYASAAKDGIAALQVARALDAGTPVDWKRVSGPRTDILFASEVRRVLEGEGDPVQALAPMSADPCAKKGQPCPDPYFRFDAQGRRALGALLDARAALKRLQVADRTGDPFPRALRHVRESDAQALTKVLLAPAPALPEGLVATSAPATAPALHASLLFVVRDGEVAYGWVPRVRLGPSGDPRFVADGDPVLPEMATIPIPRTFRPAILPIDGLAERLRGLTHGGAPTVALLASPDMEAHVVSRVLRSAMDAGLAPSVLVGRDERGGLRGVPIDLREARDGAEDDPAVRVFVRLGGFTVHTKRGSVDVPRVRDDSGLHFNLAGLSKAAGAPDIESAALEFMTVAAMGPITQAAFRLAPRGSPLQLLVP